MLLPHPSIVTRPVLSFNLESEFEFIRSVIVSHPLISMDTDFPGVVVHSHPALRQPENNYAVSKANVRRVEPTFLACASFLARELAPFSAACFFGHRVYDVKHLMKFFPNLYGALDRVSRSLNLERRVGKNHQSGSDSLLTMHIFKKIKDVYFAKENHNGMVKHASVLYGPEIV
ncbi:putative CCR4-associated factor 1 11 [Glycine max]|nr:putative CCR4-associated factor 1 11 [Glycine max]